MVACVRCWPFGVVIPSLDLEFAVAPLVGDVIEIVEYVALTVQRRRFAPDGALVLWCDPEAGSDYTADLIRDAFDERRSLSS